MPKIPGAGQLGGSLLPPSPINRPKGVHISKAENGYIVSLDKTETYDQTFKVAMTVVELTKIIAEYLD